MHDVLDSLLHAAEQDDRILAVLLYGSRARADAHASSDTDVCLVLRPQLDPKIEAADVQTDYFKFHDLDIRIYQRLPVYVRQRILKEGKVLHVTSEDDLYEVAFRTIREFEDFRPFYLAYLEEVAHG